MGDNGSSDGDIEAQNVNFKIQCMCISIGEIREYVQKYKQELESHVQFSSKIQELNKMLKTFEIVNQYAVYEEKIKNIIDHIQIMRKEILSANQNNYYALDEVQKIIIRRLNSWKNHQILTGYGDKGKVDVEISNNYTKSPSIVLDEIENWFGQLYGICVDTNQFLNEMRSAQSGLNLYDEFEQIFRDIARVQKQLVVSSLIIEEQPSQIIKKDTRFGATLRLLLSKSIIADPIEPQVTVSIYPEAQARALQRNESFIPQFSCDMTQNTGNWEHDSMNDEKKIHSVCKFKKMQVKDIRRGERKGDETVMDEKSCVIFETKLKGIPYKIFIASWPVVLVVHGSQEPKAWATITWNNAISELNQVEYNQNQNPDQLPWWAIKSILIKKFYFYTGCYLTDDHLHYLYEKLYRKSIPANPDYELVSWAQFGRNSLLPSGQKLSFWDWFYAAMKLTRDHLAEPWIKGRIAGFIAKDQAERLLYQSQTGTFLLRFSDSILGGISVAWIQMAPNQMLSVQHLQPFLHKDFENVNRATGDMSFLTIGDLIKDLHQCIYLYPKIRKEVAFDKHKTTTAPHWRYVPAIHQIVAPPDYKIESAASPQSIVSPSPFSSQYNVQSPMSYPSQTPTSSMMPSDAMNNFDAYSDISSTPMDESSNFSQLSDTWTSPQQINMLTTPTDNSCMQL